MKRCICFGNGKLKLKFFNLKWLHEADCAVDKDSKKSTLVFVTNVAGRTLSCQSKLQNCVSLIHNWSRVHHSYQSMQDVMEELLARVRSKARQVYYAMW